MKIKISKKKISKQKPKVTSGKLKPKFKLEGPKKKFKQPTLKVTQLKRVHNEEESDQGEDLLEMVDQSDLDFLKYSVVNHSYRILNKIRYSEQAESKPKRQKLNDSEKLENEYEIDSSNKAEPTMVGLLPIKTKTGVMFQSIMKDVQDEETTEIREEIVDHTDNDAQEKNLFNNFEPISTIQLLTSRNQVLQQRKINIGTLSSGFLENPEEKVANLKSLLDILEEKIPEIHYTVQKLVIISLLEIFKDILPSYEIKQISQEGVRFKKDTLKLHKYEETLLLYYKKYLQKLEKYGFSIIRKKGQSKLLSEEETKLSTLAVQAMCELLVTHPYFNFAQNIAQAIVPLMNNKNKKIREIISNSLKIIFREDKKGDITLRILRLINSFIKLHSNRVYTEMLEVLLVLNLKGVNLDQEKNLDKKQKKLKAHKSRILQLSKKERKRTKKLKEVEKELLETKAEENRDIKMKKLTEVTKMVFNIYFRILKTTENTKLLGVCFEGLAKFAHFINLEFSLDIITALDSILNENWLSPRECLHCMQTVFIILSGQGEALNVDPTRFYNRLYKDILTFNLSVKDEETVFDLIKTLNIALVKRRKKITNKRIIGYVKRIATLSLQLLHGGSIGCLGIMKNIMTLNRFVDILLDVDSSVGEGKFSAELDDPEYCNASNTALYEMTTLMKHYHPIVSNCANHIVSGSTSNSHGSLGIYSKMSLEQLYTEFSMSEMAFNPAVPVPKVREPKLKLRSHFVDQDFYDKCKRISKKNPQNLLFTKYIL